MDSNPTDKIKSQQTTFTPGPWPMEYTGDRKRIVVGEGLVEGPNGYDVAEVYSDDCPREVAVANACLIAAAPEMFAALQETLAAIRTLLPLAKGETWDYSQKRIDDAIDEAEQLRDIGIAVLAKAKGQP